MNPFLRLPVPHEIYVISEAWLYSDEEFKIHGHREHLAIDYACPRLTPVLAAADGWAMASYDNAPLIDTATGAVRTHQDKPIGYGRGYFVQIYHPAPNMFTRYYHLERIDDSIPFFEPQNLDGSYKAVNDRLRAEQYVDSDVAVYVKQGDRVGYVGDSGLEWGYVAYPTRPDPERYPSWDETHLHLKVFTRDENGTDVAVDPYDIRGHSREYPWPQHVRPMGAAHLWGVVENGLPR